MPEYENSVAELALVFQDRFVYTLETLEDDIVLWRHDKELWEENNSTGWVKFGKKAGDDFLRVLRLAQYWLLEDFMLGGYFRDG